MARLTIQQLPDDLYERLQDRASRTGRTIEAEAIVCLERGLRAASIPVARLRDSARRMGMRNPDLWLTDVDLRQARDEGRR